MYSSEKSRTVDVKREKALKAHEILRQLVSRDFRGFIQFNFRDGEIMNYKLNEEHNIEMGCALKQKVA